MLLEPTRPRLRGLLRRRKGRILAIKWGLNPNSSSLGVDVTFLLFGAAALSLATPIVSALVRLKLANSPASMEAGQADPPADGAPEEAGMDLTDA